MRIIQKKISEMTPAEYNPRKDLKKGDAEYEQIANSIKTHGYVQPIIWNQRTSCVVGGHQRLKVLKDLGYTEVDTVVVDLSEDEEKALNISLNKASGDWDNEKLISLLEEMRDKDLLDTTCFSDDELTNLMVELDINKELQEGETDPDAVPEVEDTHVYVKKGQVYQLGSHRLMCGDSLNAEDMERLMNGTRADLVVTDPPYNVDYVGKTSRALKIQNDKMNTSSFYDFLISAYTALYTHSKDGAGIYVFHADTEGLSFRGAMVETGWKLAQCCIWVKNSMVMGRQDYHWQHEPILVGWKPTAGHKWYSDRKQTTVWEFDRPTSNNEHPTMKPVALVEYPIINSSRKGDIVMDLFGGSGSTLIACEQLGRSGYIMECDPLYAQVILERWQNFTGKEGLLIKE